MQKKDLSRLAGCFLILLGLLSVSCREMEGKPKKEKVKTEKAKIEKAPDFELPGTDGKNFKLSGLKGQVILLNFWATWCGYCRREIPDLVELDKKYKEQGLTIVGMNLDRGGIKAFKPFLERNSVTYLNVVGNMEVMQKYGGTGGIPYSVLIDKRGNLAKKILGYANQQELEAEIKKLLK